MSDPAKLHNLGLKLAEARREAVRSRTVVRIIRSAYRLDDLGVSTEAITSKFLMLVVGNMMCDCAAIFYCDKPSDTRFKIVGSVGCSDILFNEGILIEVKDNIFVLDKENTEYIGVDIACFMNAQKILFVFDKSTGYAMSIGFHNDSTIESNLDISDQETMKDALAVYVDVVERRRTRRLLERAYQNAEARETEINEIVSSTTDRMLNIINFIEDSVSSLTNDTDRFEFKNKNDISNISNSIIDLKDIVSIASELINEKSPSIIIEKEWINLSEFLTVVVRNAQQVCIKQNVDIRLQKSEIKTYLWLDRIWMEMIVSTLLTEVLTYINGGGEILVESGQRDNLSITISIRASSRLTVTENEKNHCALGALRKDQVPASIRRLIDAHNANYVVEVPDDKSVLIHLSINKSECSEK